MMKGDKVANGIEDGNPEHFKGVKALIESGVDTVPQMYIRPGLSTVSCAADLPVIDMAEFNGEGRAAAMQAVGSACENWGIFWVKNHGISSYLINRVMHVVKEFFNLPSEEKMKHFTTDIMALKLYGTSFNPVKDTVLNWRDFLRLQCIPVEDMSKNWPETPPSFRDTTAEYIRQKEEFHRAIQAAILESLGMPHDYIESTYGQVSMQLVCNCYPACPNPQLTLGLTPHSDPGWVTDLIQDDIGGLQILHGDHWLDVQPRPDAFVVLLADQFQILSNGRYKSVEHRVVVKNVKERFSLVTATMPAMDKTVTPAIELLVGNGGGRALYKGRQYGEYLQGLYSRPLDGKSGLRSLVVDSGIAVEDK
eukprot:Gb_28914 [translate_table: standard]